MHSLRSVILISVSFRSFRGKGLYRLSEALVERDGVLLPQTPCRSSGVYDNGAPHGAFTWVESAQEIDGLL